MSLSWVVWMSCAKPEMTGPKPSEAAHPVPIEMAGPMPSAGAVSRFVSLGEPVKLRGSAMDYAPGDVPAGTYPVVDERGEIVGTATCPKGGSCVVTWRDGKLEVEQRTP